MTLIFTGNGSILVIDKNLEINHRIFRFRIVHDKKLIIDNQIDERIFELSCPPII